MQGCIRADGADRKGSIDLILAAVLVAGVLFFGAGCQKNSSRISDGAAIRHAE